MNRRAHIALLGLTLAFIACGAAFAFFHGPAPIDRNLLSAADRLLGSAGNVMLQLASPTELPLMQLRHQGAYSLLMVIVWGLLLLDSIGQIIEPAAGGQMQIDLMTTQAGALAFGAVWPWLILPAPGMATMGAVISATFAVLSVVLARGDLRPAVGFMAGWATMLAAAMLALLLGGVIGMGLPATIIMATIIGTVTGTTVTLWLGHSVAYPLAIIGWLSALIITLLGSSTSITLTAIAAITVMAVALVRSVT